MKTGLVLEGGAYRGIFTTGVLKVLDKYNVDFQYIVGVSAGAGNIVDYVSGRDEISRSFISVSRKHSSYGFKQLIKSGYLLNIDSLVKDMVTIDSNEIAEAVMSSPKDIEIVCTNCNTGKAEYLFERKSLRRLIDIAKASCAVPVLCKEVIVGNTPYVDGSVTDAIPVRRTLEKKKCDKAVVILTRRPGETPTDYTKAMPLIRMLYHKKYPRLEQILIHRLEEYSRQAEYLEQMEKEGRAFVIRPSIPSINRFESDQDKLRSFYIHGIDTMEFKIEDLKKFLEN